MSFPNHHIFSLLIIQSSSETSETSEPARAASSASVSDYLFCINGKEAIIITLKMDKYKFYNLVLVFIYNYTIFNHSFSSFQ